MSYSSESEFFAMTAKHEAKIKAERDKAEVEAAPLDVMASVMINMEDIQANMAKEEDAVIEDVAAKQKLKGRASNASIAKGAKQTAREVYQKNNTDPDAWIENKALLSKATALAKEMGKAEASKEAVTDNVRQISEGQELNDKQLKTLEAFVVRKMQPFLALDKMEAKLLAASDKNLLWMYCCIKHEVAVGDDIELGQATARKLFRLSPTDIPARLAKLEKLGFLICAQRGTKGAKSGRSTIYRRLI